MSFISDQSKKRRAETGSKAAGPGGGNKAVGLTARRVSDRMFTSILVGVMLVGIGLLAYPTLSDYWNSYHQSKAVRTYSENVEKMNSEDYGRILDEARSYNAELAGRGIRWTLSDESVFAIETVSLEDGNLIKGLQNGLVGVREGEECWILFSGKNRNEETAASGLISSISRALTHGTVETDYISPAETGTDLRNSKAGKTTGLIGEAI